MNRKQSAALLQPLAQDLEGIASALRAGSSLMQAVQIIAQESHGPLASEWALVVKDVQHGRSVSQALHQFETRCPHPSVATFVGITTILQGTGGNLAGSLLTLSESMNQEIAFQSKLRAMTAQGRLSGYVVGAMPFVIMAALAWLAPELVRPLLTTATGWLMVLGVIVMVSIGTFLIDKLVQIDV